MSDNREIEHSFLLAMHQSYSINNRRSFFWLPITHLDKNNHPFRGELVHN